MDDKFLIHVEIAGKSYGIRINRSEEQVAREAVRQIRKKMDQYRKKYSDVDVKDLLNKRKEMSKTSLSYEVSHCNLFEYVLRLPQTLG